MQKIQGWYRRNFVAPRKRAQALEMLRSLMPELKKFQKELVLLKIVVDTNIEKMPPAEKIPLIVNFFNIVSPWHDRGIEQLVLAFEAADMPETDHVRTLSKHFARAGRSPSGYNRTVKGQKVTADDVWLGDRCGLWTKTVSYWVTRGDDQREVCQASNGQPMTICDVIWWQAGDFIDSHLEGILPILDRLERLAQEGKS